MAENIAVETFLAVRDILKKSGNAWAYNMCYKTPPKFYRTHSVDECVKMLLDKYTYFPNCCAKMDGEENADEEDM
ncbi:MAG: hypothetical protein NC401_13895 [Ruminococcus sp.]|nr:hypothetical protein [Ruminococcus sp.]